MATTNSKITVLKQLQLKKKILSNREFISKSENYVTYFLFMQFYTYSDFLVYRSAVSSDFTVVDLSVKALNTNIT